MSKLISNSSLLRRVLVVCAVCALGGCALSRQMELYPEIYAAERPQQIDVFVDVAVLTDLSDEDLGIDLARNRRAADAALERLTGILGNAGYTLNTVRSGYGVVQAPGDEPMYLAEGTKSTGLAYTGPEPASAGDPWIANDARNFLRALVITGYARRNPSDLLDTADEYAALAHLAHPAALDQVKSRHLLLLRVSAYDAAMIKEAAAMVGGIIIGVGMAAAGSPIVLVPYLRTSYTQVELVLYDTWTREVAWSATHMMADDGPTDQKYALGEAAATFPAHEGRKARYPRTVTKR